MQNQTIEKEEVKKIVEECIRKNNKECNLNNKGISVKEIQFIMNILKQNIIYFKVLDNNLFLLLDVSFFPNTPELVKGFFFPSLPKSKPYSL